MKVLEICCCNSNAKHKLPFVFPLRMPLARGGLFVLIMHRVRNEDQMLPHDSVRDLNCLFFMICGLGQTLMVAVDLARTGTHRRVKELRSSTSVLNFAHFILERHETR